MRGKKGNGLELQTLLSSKNDEKEDVDGIKQDIHSKEGRPGGTRAGVFYYYCYKLVRHFGKLIKNFQTSLKASVGRSPSAI